MNFANFSSQELIFNAVKIEKCIFQTGISGYEVDKLRRHTLNSKNRIAFLTSSYDKSIIDYNK